MFSNKYCDYTEALFWTSGLLLVLAAILVALFHAPHTAESLLVRQFDIIGTIATVGFWCLILRSWSLIFDGITATGNQSGARGKLIQGVLIKGAAVAGVFIVFSTSVQATPVCFALVTIEQIMLGGLIGLVFPNKSKRLES